MNANGPGINMSGLFSNMKKQDFLADQQVRHFIQYVVGKCEANFPFQLAIGRGKAIKYITINSIKEAYLNYEWSYSLKQPIPLGIPANGKTLADSEPIFQWADKALLGDKKAKLQAIETILKWGGVFSKDSDVGGILNSLEAVKGHWQMVQENKAEFNSMSHSFNAGISKVHSVYLNDFAIYDSRVSVALAYLIQDCFKAVEIPQILKIHLPPPRVKDMTRKAVHPFFTKSNTSKQYYCSNVKASLLFKEIINKLNTNEWTMRKLEAALFMIGNDIRNGRSEG